MIKTKHGDFDGNSWEEFCHTCLTLKFETVGYQKLHAWKGDLGIESYTRTGIVFQCYCPEEDYEPQTLYEKQRDKITKDLNKLEKNKAELKKYLGKQKIRKWIFLTPMFKNKELVKHCQEKASEYMAKNIDILSPDFDVLVYDIDYFIKQIPIVKGYQNEKLELIVDRDASNDVDWKSENIELVNNAIGKYSKCIAKGENKDEKINKLTHFAVEHYLTEQQILNKWQQMIPMQYEKFLRVVGDYENTVEEMCITNSNDNNQLLDKIKTELKSKLENDFSNLDSLTIEKITKGVLADWILRCPINFE